jgi:hypothetical protein
MEMQSHQAQVPLFFGITHQAVSRNELPSRENPKIVFAVLSFLKNASFRHSNKPSAAT